MINIKHFIYIVHLLSYCLIIKNSNKFKSICDKYNKDPCLIIHNIVVITKTLQILTLIYFIHIYNIIWKYELGSIILNNPIQLCLIILGQYLNYSVYDTIGINGVCYGTYFGKNIPWVNGFPFNVKYLSHPQYIGTWLTYINISYIIYNSTIYHEIFHNDIKSICILLTYVYIFTGYLEAKLEPNQNKKNN